jgi:hypothetical protein
VELFVLLGALAVIGVVAAVATGRVRGGLDESTASRPHRGLPEQMMGPDDVDAVRFELAARDAELAARDAELAARRPPEPADETGKGLSTDDVTSR